MNLVLPATWCPCTEIAGIGPQVDLGMSGCGETLKSTLSIYSFFWKTPNFIPSEEFYLYVGYCSSHFDHTQQLEGWIFSSSSQMWAETMC